MHSTAVAEAAYCSRHVMLPAETVLSQGGCRIQAAAFALPCAPNQDSGLLGTGHIDLRLLGAGPCLTQPKRP